MKVLIDTTNKTLKLEGPVKVKELHEFAKSNGYLEYQVLPEYITVKEFQYYPSYPWSTPPFYTTPEYTLAGSGTANTCSSTSFIADIS